jgi:hypothetical protein
VAMRSPHSRCVLAPMRPWTVALPVVLLVAPGLARAAPPEPPEPPVSQDVIVTAPKPAKVIATYPADGATTLGGIAIVKIVFDQPMAADAWSYTPSENGKFPACLARPRLLSDRRTFVLLCTLEVGATYALEINAPPQFKTTAGRRPPTMAFSFKTEDHTTTSLHDALDRAGLSDADDPIMASVPAEGAVRSPPRPPESNPG